MTLKKIGGFLGGLLLSVCALTAQEPMFVPAEPVAEPAAEQTRVRPAIIDSILSVPDAGAPLVVIRQDPRIEGLIQDKIEGRRERLSTHIQGYRVQVYSSNTQKTAKAEAFKTEKKVTADFPNINVYVLYQPPFWKVRLGNFRTKEEAAILHDELRNKYPNMQGDIYIVKDRIEVAD